MNQPLVSIIIPCFNRGHLISETLDSVTKQTYTNWECIIVDDGSGDGSQSLIKQYVANDDRVQFYERHREPKGAPACRNIGLEKSKADFVMFLDSDDLLGYYCLEQRSSAIAKDKDKDFWVFPMLLFKEKVDDIRLYTNLSNHENDLFRFLRSDLPWSISCVVWRKSFLKSLNGFDESFPNCQDHDLHLRALWNTQNYASYPEAIPDNFYRQHTGDKIYNPKDKKRVLVGARMLVYRHAEVIYRRKGCTDQNAYHSNLLIFFKYLLKEHLFIKDYHHALELKEYMKKKEIISSLWAHMFTIYIHLARSGFDRMKGFYRFWDLVFYKYRRKSNWGKISFKGELQFNPANYTS